MTWFTSFLRRPPIGWWDVADILVVSVLIYEVLKLIRGTRAVQMAVGGALFGGLFYGSRFFHLETVNWLIRNFAGYVVFGVIVLFQSDIRRALAHFGRAPFFRYFAKAESAEDSVEELVVAAGLLASQRVGAVIVQDDRVAAAACFLPLTVNPKLSKELGSRHRAAIGLTEENDAVAIVISEESGKISIVVDGQIDRGLGTDELRSRLRSLVLHRRVPARKSESRVQYT